ncbi:MAG: bifunctional UDP-N-acetylmuramoyl-tripeptide:D-alanyl-D-alanine ligase/alanine racemase [Prevotella sp.]|nr:bifunctional UDP-N-acetylmuramoyl-tripeptide:D-alanyl-D-alanine ligase/alanine racemase [Prevotella sp.]
MKYTIEKITTLIGARRIGDTEAVVSWLLTDSRSLCFPEETLFFALRSGRNDGHNYIPELYRRGVRNFVVERGHFRLSDVTRVSDVTASTGTGGGLAGANILEVVSPLEALQRLAERHRDEFDVPIVGITGSNGKTMVKEWLYQLLSPYKIVTRSPKSYNSQIGVPLSVWLLGGQTEVGLFEAGISQPGEMQALRDIIQPSIGVLTSLGTAHQENFRSMDEKCQEKLSLFHDAKVVAYNSDDNVVSRCMRKSGYHGEKLSWSKEDPQAAMFIKKIERRNTVSTLYYIYKGKEGTYHLPFIDDASVECSIAAAVVALYLGVTPEELDVRMSQLEPVAMRLEVKEGQHGCTLINDSYNSDINSLDIALDFMSRRPDQEGKSRTLILSDIYQSGVTPHELYHRVMELAVKRGVTKFIGIGKEIKRILAAEGGGQIAGDQTAKLPGTVAFFFDDVEEFLRSEVFKGLRNEIVLIKGARDFGFDQITEMLEQKVHETILEVNLNAVVENLNHFRSYMKPDTKIICMVKADAYGAGAVEVSKTLQDHRVDYLAVAVADEGVTLRKNGITSNIMIMNPEMTAFKTMFDYDLEPEVYSFRIMDALIKAAEKEGITNYPVHIKLDTGMHRLGFDPVQDIDEVINRLKHQNAIIPRSVFSHFVGSDSDDFDTFSAHQFELFDTASKKLQSAFEHKILRHICNSAGIEHFPERQLDACRLGIGLYGVDSRDNHIINTVSTLKTTILQLRHVPKDETVGYSRKGVLTRDSVIAAIPIGYADGLNRHLGRGKGYCLVNGQKAPYVGNICMDVALIDVTDIPCKEGDTVEIFGEHLPVTVLSDILDTIPYEVLTGVSNRVKKVYYQD